MDGVTGAVYYIHACDIHMYMHIPWGSTTSTVKSTLLFTLGFPGTYATQEYSPPSDGSALHSSRMERTKVTLATSVVSV